LDLSKFTPAKECPKIYEFKIWREMNAVNLKPALDKFYGADNKSSVSRLDEKYASRKLLIVANRYAAKNKQRRRIS